MENEVRLSTMQKEIHSWSTKNFGKKVELAFDVSSFLGIVEETGELAHSILKMSQGIRGSNEQHLKDATDAIGDILVYLLDFVERNADQFGGIDADAMLTDVWNRVKKRDWTKDKIGGLPMNLEHQYVYGTPEYERYKMQNTVKENKLSSGVDEPHVEEDPSSS